MHVPDDASAGRTVKVSLTRDLACDVWTSHLRDRSLVLGGDDIILVPPENSRETPGARKRALFMQDIENSTDAWGLETHSDVFALHQEEVRPSQYH